MTVYSPHYYASRIERSKKYISERLYQPLYCFQYVFFQAYCDSSQYFLNVFVWSYVPLHPEIWWQGNLKIPLLKINFLLTNRGPREGFYHISEQPSVKLSFKNTAKEQEVICNFPPSQAVVLIISYLVVFRFLPFFFFFIVILMIALAVMEPLYATVTICFCDTLINKVTLKFLCSVQSNAKGSRLQSLSY